MSIGPSVCSVTEWSGSVSVVRTNGTISRPLAEVSFKRWIILVKRERNVGLAS